MCQRLIVSFISLSLIVNISALNATCYIDESLTEDNLIPPDCNSSVKLLKRDLNEECDDLPGQQKFKLFQPMVNPERFHISLDEPTNNVILLRVTITNIQFDTLTIRIKDLAIPQQPNSVYCHTIKGIRNETGEPKQLSFYNQLQKRSQVNYRFFAEWKGSNFIKDYSLAAPVFANDITKNELFTYIDNTLPDMVYLYVQPLPERYNVSKYNVWLKAPEGEQQKFDLYSNGSEHMQHNHTYFSFENGPYYFFVQPIHQKCDNNTLCRTVSAYFYLSSTQKYWIMIVSTASTVWVLIVIFFALRSGYTYYKNRALHNLKNAKPSCLLLYPAVSNGHVDCMIQLTKYLRECQINAMIDVLDVQQDTYTNPSKWCDDAFEKADVVIMAPSPSHSKNSIVTTTVYRKLDDYARRLIQENYSRKNKRYLAVQFPYCKNDSMYDEARRWPRFKIPKDLNKLVNKIHNADYVKIFGKPNQELADNIKMAINNVLNGEPNSNSRLHDKPAGNPCSIINGIPFHDHLIGSSVDRNSIKEDDGADVASISDDDKNPNDIRNILVFGMDQENEKSLESRSRALPTDGHAIVSDGDRNSDKEDDEASTSEDDENPDDIRNILILRNDEEYE